MKSAEVDRHALGAVLERSRSLGLLGDGPVDEHINHALSFVELLPTSGPILDLGTGGGVPGLVVAAACAGRSVTLLDANERRCAFLRWAVVQLGLSSVQVVESRAEVAGRGEDRGRYIAVTARSFGAPATTAECGAPLLVPGGVLLVSEPPDIGVDRVWSRWPPDALGRIGLEVATRTRTSTATIQALRLVGPVPDNMPRSSRQMARSPIF